MIARYAFSIVIGSVVALGLMLSPLGLWASIGVHVTVNGFAFGMLGHSVRERRRLRARARAV